jgi:hypothetical protein
MRPRTPVQPERCPLRERGYTIGYFHGVIPSVNSLRTRAVWVTRADGLHPSVRPILGANPPLGGVTPFPERGELLPVAGQ